MVHRQREKPFADVGSEDTAITLRLGILEDQYGRGRALPRGGWRLLKSNVAPDGSEHEPIYALGWYDRRAKFIVSSCGCTVPAEPSRRKRHRRVIVSNEYETIVSYKEIP